MRPQKAPPRSPGYYATRSFSSTIARRPENSCQLSAKIPVVAFRSLTGSRWGVDDRLTDGIMVVTGLPLQRPSIALEPIETYSDVATQ